MAALSSLEGLYISNTNLSGSLSCDLALLPNMKAIEASNTRIESCLTLECLEVMPECLSKNKQQEHGIEL